MPRAESQPKELPLISDDEGFVLSTWEYCLTGEKEGWLKNNGQYIHNGLIYHYFVFT